MVRGRRRPLAGYRFQVSLPSVMPFVPRGRASLFTHWGNCAALFIKLYVWAIEVNNVSITWNSGLCSSYSKQLCSIIYEIQQKHCLPEWFIKSHAFRLIIAKLSFIFTATSIMITIRYIQRKYNTIFYNSIKISFIIKYRYLHNSPLELLIT